jgi:hypothetical protein
MQNMNKDTMSWIWIIIGFVVFWPIGLFLLLKKLASDKGATIKCHKKVMNISYLVMAIGAFYLITAISGSPGMFMPAILFGAGGFCMYKIALKIKATGERYKKYIVMIVNQSQTSIDNLASAVGVSYDEAVKDLQKMIDMGYFTGAYIDVSQREIILARPTQQQANNAAVASEQVKLVSCRSCGANNRSYSGQIGECEYCGSPI